MAAIFNNRAKAKIDSDGNFLRQKYQGVAALSMGYGLYLGETTDKWDSCKAFFLMTSFVPGTGEVFSPADIRTSSRLSTLTLDVLPFSKKFTLAEDLLLTLTAGNDYWFLYTSEPVSRSIDGKVVTFEQLDLICIADTSGPDGIRSLLPLFKLQKSS